MTKKQMTDYLLKFQDTSKYALLEKYFFLRKNKTIDIKGQKFIILEPLMYHIVGVENKTMEAKDFIFENTFLDYNEIDYLPINVFRTIQNEIYKIISETDKKEDTEHKKK